MTRLSVFRVPNLSDEVNFYFRTGGVAEKRSLCLLPGCHAAVKGRLENRKAHLANKHPATWAQITAAFPHQVNPNNGKYQKKSQEDNGNPPKPVKIITNKPLKRM